MFTEGNLTTSEMSKWLNAHGANNQQFVDNNQIVTFKFRLQNKNYEISCSKSAATSQTDNITQNLFYKSTINSIVKTFGISEDEIAEFFVAVKTIGGNTQTYTINPNCGCKTYNDVIAAIKSKYPENNITTLTNMVTEYLKGNTRDYQSVLKQIEKFKTKTLTNADKAKVNELVDAIRKKAAELVKNAIVVKAGTEYFSPNGNFWSYDGVVLKYNEGQPPYHYPLEMMLESLSEIPTTIVEDFGGALGRISDPKLVEVLQGTAKIDSFIQEYLSTHSYSESVENLPLYIKDLVKIYMSRSSEEEQNRIYTMLCKSIGYEINEEATNVLDDLTDITDILEKYTLYNNKDQIKKLLEEFLNQKLTDKSTKKYNKDDLEKYFNQYLENKTNYEMQNIDKDMLKKIFENILYTENTDSLSKESLMNLYEKYIEINTTGYTYNEEYINNAMEHVYEKYKDTEYSNISNYANAFISNKDINLLYKQINEGVMQYNANPNIGIKPKVGPEGPENGNDTINNYDSQQLIYSMKDFYDAFRDNKELAQIITKKTADIISKLAQAFANDDLGEALKILKDVPELLSMVSSFINGISKNISSTGYSTYSQMLKKIESDMDNLKSATIEMQTKLTENKDKYGNNYDYNYEISQLENLEYQTSVYSNMLKTVKFSNLNNEIEKWYDNDSNGEKSIDDILGWLDLKFGSLKSQSKQDYIRPNDEDSFNYIVWYYNEQSDYESQVAGARRVQIDPALPPLNPQPINPTFKPNIPGINLDNVSISLSTLKAKLAEKFEGRTDITQEELQNAIRSIYLEAYFKKQAVTNAENTETTNSTNNSIYKDYTKILNNSFGSLVDYMVTEIFTDTNLPESTLNELWDYVLNIFNDLSDMLSALVTQNEDALRKAASKLKTALNGLTSRLTQLVNADKRAKIEEINNGFFPSNYGAISQDQFDQINTLMNLVNNREIDISELIMELLSMGATVSVTDNTPSMLGSTHKTINVVLNGCSFTIEYTNGTTTPQGNPHVEFGVKPNTNSGTSISTDGGLSANYISLLIDLLKKGQNEYQLQQSSNEQNENETFIFNS